ncbi:hypothetical protein JCM24511_08255 [Saitozyma sp. JCM 24511]|nr:hypothetical protein JCM24511_08255 [Saitozyma sp. JCM 24511]
MDLSYNLVASKCAEQMAKYQECVLANQSGDWSNICRAQGVALTQCADTAVPHLRELKSGCASEIAAYRTCLERNERGSDAELGEKCGGLMKTVWECSERVMKAVEAGNSATSGSVEPSASASTSGSSSGPGPVGSAAGGSAGGRLV